MDATVGPPTTAVGVVGGVPGTAHQATVTTVDQTQIITLQVGDVTLTGWMWKLDVHTVPKVHVSSSSRLLFSALRL